MSAAKPRKPFFLPKRKREYVEPPDEGSSPYAVDRRDSPWLPAKDAAAGPIDAPLWETATHIGRSADGSAGVLFIETAVGVFVVKASAEVFQEYFGAELARALDVRVPAIRIVPFRRDEWRAVKEVARRLEVRGSPVWCKAQKELDRPFIMVMEYVARARTLQGMYGEEAERLLRGEETLHQLGLLQAYDLLINNHDRMPLVWSNEGNARNIMLTDEGHVVGVDQPIRCMKLHARETAVSVAKYRNKVLRLAGGMLAGDFTPMQRVRTFIMNETGVDVGDEGVAHMVAGFRDGVSRVASLPDGWMEDTKSRLERAGAGVDWRDVWAQMVDGVKLPWLKEAMSMFRAIHREQRAVSDEEWQEGRAGEGGGGEVGSEAAEGCEEAAGEGAEAAGGEEGKAEG